MSAITPIKTEFFSILVITIMLMTNTAMAKEEKTEEKSKKTETTEKENKGELKVNITDTIPFLEVNHEGKVVRIQRIQDVNYKLTNSFSRTSRKCPPFCVRPIKLEGDVETVGELELLQFLKEKVRDDTGILIDARLKDWHVKGTIPGSVSIPFTMFTGGLQDINTVKLLELLGAKEGDNDKWAFDEAIDLMLFCNGPWCGQSPKAIKHLLKLGYPAEKIYWYRGGMQAWQSFGLTTIKP